MMKKLLLSMLASGALLATTVHADAKDSDKSDPHASCKQRDLNGHYVMYQNSVGLANLHTGRCEIAIHNGQAAGECAFNITAKDANGNNTVVPGFNGAVSGAASINSHCAIALELAFSPMPNVTVSSTFDLQFTPDRQSFIGQWTNNFGLLGTSSGTRF